MIDLVYPLKSETGHHCKELLFSLRSVEKYLSNIGKVYIIGTEIPQWSTGLELIFSKDYVGQKYKEFNIAAKVCSACLHPEVSNPFLFMNDDHYLLDYFEADTFPNFYYGTIEKRVNKEANPRNMYITACNNTIKHLQTIGKDTLYFDVHCPILYDKNAFYKITKNIHWPDCGYVIKSLYGNTLNLPGIEYPDCKLKPPFNKDAFNNRPWISNCNLVIKHGLFDKLEELFPAKSKWEL